MLPSINNETIPILKWLVLFVAIILWNEFSTTTAPNTILVYALSSSLLFLVLAYSHLRYNPFLAIIPILALGIYVHTSTSLDQEIRSNNTDRLFEVQGIIISKKESAKSSRIVIQSSEISNRIVNRSSSLRFYLNVDSIRMKQISKHDSVRLSAKIRWLKASNNPCDFNEKQFWRLQEVVGQLYDASDFSSSKNESLIHSTTSFLRSKHASKIDQVLKRDDNKMLLKALIQGDKTSLDQALKTKFRQLGLAHLLALSGLHIGIIYLLLISLLKLLFPFYRYRIFRSIIIILGIWAFCVYAGNSNSMIRACLMFTILEIGHLLKRKNSGINSLCLAAFILLVWKPNNLFDIGFQLSFSAVAGIILLVPYLEKRHRHTNKLFHKYVLSVCYVSLAAQLFTLPFVLYHFHEVSLSGLAINIVAIPLTFLATILGAVGLFMGSFIPPAQTTILKICEFFLTCLNEMANYLVHHNLNIQLSNVSLSAIVALVLGLTLIFLTVYLYHSKRSHLVLSLLLAILAMSSILYEDFSSSDQPPVTIFSARGVPALQILQKDHIISYQMEDFFSKNMLGHHCQLPIEKRLIGPQELQVRHGNKKYFFCTSIKSIKNLPNDGVTIILSKNIRPRELKSVYTNSNNKYIYSHYCSEEEWGNEKNSSKAPIHHLYWDGIIQE